MQVARLTTAVGIVIAIAGGVFVVRAIASQWTDVRRSIDDANVVWLVAGGALAASTMVAIALPWRRALALLGADVTVRATIVWYFVGEIGKYVPGGIWPVVGRAELARRGGIPRAASYASVALSLGALYLAGMLVAAALLPLRFLHGGATAWLWVLVLLPIGVALLHHRVLTWLVRHAERMLKRELTIIVPRWSQSLRLVLEYVPGWLLLGTATWCVARAFTANASWTTIAPAAMISWVAGFVLVPVPGGIGVREAAFVALVGGGIGSGTRAAIAVTARLAFMLVDALGAGIGALWRAGREPARVVARVSDDASTRERVPRPSSTAAGSTRP